MEGRFVGYVPSISEVVTGIYNTKFFTPAMTIITFLLIILIYLMIVWGEIWRTFPTWFVRLGQTFMFIIPLCYFGLAGCTLDTQFATHISLTMVGLFLILLLNIFVVAILWKRMNTSLKVTRLVFLIISSLTYFFMFISRFIIPHKEASLTASLEFIFVISICVLMLSWTVELRSIDCEFYVEDQ
ncbi:hypothetical protein TVAG_268690 [Trichomonas vaginalis G3]|uniref:CWH43-like N-terminal domain-containing protein n=1 Tax=Trichomonas vaginalis (strain ATCC PRA-98 / G3) TaxID=412133 RepID=A2G4C0_TRIV3|nr:hypothetical protein TVAGG3_0929970 [Trichomonas vaginalis G3]EAX88001.1 hypothetical protein TVAG_268690 [Trichomonas vaginalis G3]KAI5485762.1 hypothetical protein TVAGG3_0929970 [Trichomonas vaginalis G3]|eukprot:XP_001300931.1 hypothetical protein [Trichomonas vaginalis G3]